MLILNRKPGDAVLIDGEIRVVVLATDAGGVRLGIEAPSHVGILREELVESVREETRRAGAGDEAREFLRRVAGGRSGRSGAEESGTGDTEGGDAGPDDAGPETRAPDA